MLCHYAVIDHESRLFLVKKCLLVVHPVQGKTGKNDGPVLDTAAKFLGRQVGEPEAYLIIKARAELDDKTIDIVPHVCVKQSFGSLLGIDVGEIRHFRERRLVILEEIAGILDKIKTRNPGKSHAGMDNAMPLRRIIPLQLMQLGTDSIRELIDPLIIIGMRGRTKLGTLHLKIDLPDDTRMEIIHMLTTAGDDIDILLSSMESICDIISKLRTLAVDDHIDALVLMERIRMFCKDDSEDVLMCPLELSSSLKIIIVAEVKERKVKGFLKHRIDLIGIAKLCQLMAPERRAVGLNHAPVIINNQYLKAHKKTIHSNIFISIPKS